MQRMVAQVELPSSNKAEMIHRFIAEVTERLDPAQGMEVTIEWRSNRRFLSLMQSAPLPS